MEKIKALVTAEIIRSTLEGLCGDRVSFTYDGYNLNHDVMEHEKLRSIIVYNNSGRDASIVEGSVLGYMIDMTCHITSSNYSLHNCIIR